MDDIQAETLQQLLQYIAPNLRFGASFLNSIYRDRAINDEVMMDKSTGALTYKRQADGDFMHFDRENISIADWAMQIKTTYATDLNYVYPTKENCSVWDTTYLMGTLFDLQSFSYQDELITKVEEGASLVNTDNVPFNVTHEANGFFVKLMVRPRDVAIINLLSTVYDRYFSSYIGENPEWLAQKERLETEPGYKETNACVKYTIRYYKDGEETWSSSITGHVMVQEVSYLPLLVDQLPDRENVDRVTISIDEISLPKIQPAYQVKEYAFTNEELEIYEKIKDVDLIGLKYLEVFSYSTITDPVYTVPSKENSRIHYFLRMDGVEKLFQRVDTLTASGLTIDDELDPDSKNPISNSAVAKFIEDVVEKIQEDLKKLAEDLDRALKEKVPDDLLIEGTKIYLSLNGNKIGKGQKLPGGTEIGEIPPEDNSITWIDTANGGIHKYWDGSSWVPIRAVWR